MPSSCAGRLVALLPLLTLWPALALAQPPKAGVVTTLQGQATVARAVLPQPVPLKFKDDVLVRDNINTRENSVVRVLLGGKALVTIRELSTFTVTEEPGRAVVDLQKGTLAVAVAKHLLKPGESIEVRTPNAIAAVRGSLLIAVVTIVAGVPRTEFFAPQVSTPVLVATRAAPALTVPLGEKQTLNVLGGGAAAALGAVVNMTAAQLQAASKDAQAPKPEKLTEKPPELLLEKVKAEKTQEFGQLANFLAPPPGAPPPPPPDKGLLEHFEKGLGPPQFVLAAIQNFFQQLLDACKLDPTKCQFVPPPNLIQNPGFETGDLTGWSKLGAGKVISSFGTATITPPEGSFMFLGHTGNGAVGAGGDCSTAGNLCQKSTLSQAIDVKSTLFVSFKYVLLTKEAYCPSSPCSLFDKTDNGVTLALNDKWTVTLTPSSGSPVTLFETTVSAELTAGTFFPFGQKFAADTDGFTGNFSLIPTSGKTHGPVGDFTTIGKTVVVSPGSATLEFAVFDVGDSAFDSGALLDVVIVTQDPPLYFLKDGSTFTRTDPAPFFQFTNTPQTFDSLAVVCCGSTAKLAGPLLRATNSSLTVPFSLVSLLQGGTLATSSTDPLVRLEGGSHSLGSTVGVFDIAGVNTALDPASGLTLGTDRPLQHSGSLLEASGATVTTQTVLKLDTALLEASAPLLNLSAGSSVTTATHAVDLSLKAQLASVGPLVKLDGSSLNVKGALFNVNGSVLRGSGPLLSLSGGSTLSASLLANVLRSGQFTWAGPLAVFSGSGNSLSFSNSLCAANSCVTVGGLKFALQNGALSSNISVTNSTPWVGAGTSGTVNLSADGAHFLVQGSTSTVKISP